MWRDSRSVLQCMHTGRRVWRRRAAHRVSIVDAGFLDGGAAPLVSANRNGRWPRLGPKPIMHSKRRYTLGVALVCKRGGI